MIHQESREFKILVLRILHFMLYCVGTKTPSLRTEMQKLTEEIMEFVKDLKRLMQQDYESRIR